MTKATRGSAQTPAFPKGFVWGVAAASCQVEGAEGYKQRFGLVHVDYTTQRHTLKDSAYWYKAVIASNGATLEKTH